MDRDRRFSKWIVLLTPPLSLALVSPPLVVASIKSIAITAVDLSILNKIAISWQRNQNRHLVDNSRFRFFCTEIVESESTHHYFDISIHSLKFVRVPHWNTLYLCCWSKIRLFLEQIKTTLSWKETLIKDVGDIELSQDNAMWIV